MSELQTPDEGRLRAIFRALSDFEVEYAVFGAVALGLHGLARATADLDLFIRSDAVNVERLKVVTPRTLWRLKKDTSRPTDRFDADVLAERFGFHEEEHVRHSLPIGRGDVQAMESSERSRKPPARGADAGHLPKLGA